MNQTTLPAIVRQKTGKGIARRLRAEQKIPAVLYGPHMDEPLPIAVSPKALRAAIRTPTRLNTILTLEFDNGDKKTALLKDYQQDPLTRNLLHADFYEVQADKPVTVQVPIVLKGEPKGVAYGGVLSQTRREVDVLALPTAIPASLEVDVSDMGFNDVLHVADIKVPEGVQIVYQTNYSIAVLVAPSAAEEEKAEEAAEGEEAAS